MSINFNCQRFFKLCINEIRLNYQKTLLFLGGLMVLESVYFLMNYSYKNILQIDNTAIVFITVLIIAHGFYTSIHCGEFASRRKKESLLMTPASRSEIFMTKFVFNYIVYPVVVCLLFFIGMKLVVYYNFKIDPDWETYNNDANSLTRFYMQRWCFLLY